MGSLQLPHVHLGCPEAYQIEKDRWTTSLSFYFHQDLSPSLLKAMVPVLILIGRTKPYSCLCQVLDTGQQEAGGSPRSVAE